MLRMASASMLVEVRAGTKSLEYRSNERIIRDRYFDGRKGCLVGRSGDIWCDDCRLGWAGTLLVPIDSIPLDVQIHFMIIIFVHIGSKN